MMLKGCWVKKPTAGFKNILHKVKKNCKFVFNNLYNNIL